MAAARQPLPHYGLPPLPSLPCPEFRGPTPWSNWVIRGRVLAGAPRRALAARVPARGAARRPGRPAAHEPPAPCSPPLAPPRRPGPRRRLPRLAGRLRDGAHPRHAAGAGREHLCLPAGRVCAAHAGERVARGAGAAPLHQGRAAHPHPRAGDAQRAHQAGAAGRSGACVVRALQLPGARGWAGTKRSRENDAPSRRNAPLTAAERQRLQPVLTSRAAGPAAKSPRLPPLPSFRTSWTSCTCPSSTAA